MIKIGEEFEGKVRDLASDGRGIIPHPTNAVVFVEGVWLDEDVLVQITAIRGRAFEGRVISIQSAHPQRRDPPCQHHGFSGSQCGGCAWQFMSYDAQAEAKQARVMSQFEKLNCADKVRPIWAANEEFGYRNRAQFKTDGEKLGFLASASHQLASIKDCLVLTKQNRDTLSHLLELLPQSNWRPHKKKKWVSLDVDEDVTAEFVSINKRLPFKQGNDRQNIRMQEWIDKKLCESQSVNILELFCGSGNFTECMTAEGRNILAVEGSESAVNELNSKMLENVKGIEANLFSENVYEKIYNVQREFDTIVLDPPRDGLKVTKGLLTKKSKVKHIIYASCDVATLVRDVKYFQENKFKVKEIQPLDLFPQTAHIECLVYMTK